MPSVDCTQVWALSVGLYVVLMVGCEGLEREGVVSLADGEVLGSVRDGAEAMLRSGVEVLARDGDEALVRNWVGVASRNGAAVLARN